MNKGIIQVEDKFYKKCKVVMLPTEKESKVVKIITTNSLTFHQKNVSAKGAKYLQNQHLYILSDEEIKEGDWCMCDDRNSILELPKYFVGKCKSIENNWINVIDGQGENPDWTKKIISSIDPELKLPRPSDAFLKAYCEKDGIDEVLVEYIGKQYKIGDIVYPDGTKRVVSKGTFYSDSNKGYYYFTNDNRDGWRLEEYELKVAPDNTITIKPVKNSWNREEVKNLLKSMSYFASEQTIYNGREYYMEYEKIDKWIEQNL